MAWFNGEKINIGESAYYYLAPNQEHKVIFLSDGLEHTTQTGKRKIRFNPVYILVDGIPTKKILDIGGYKLLCMLKEIAQTNEGLKGLGLKIKIETKFDKYMYEIGIVLNRPSVKALSLDQSPISFEKKHRSTGETITPNGPIKVGPIKVGNSGLEINKEETLECPSCGVQIPKPDYVNHVSEHKKKGEL